MVVDGVEALNYDSLETVAHLRASERYQDIMQVLLDCSTSWSYLCKNSWIQCSFLLCKGCDHVSKSGQDSAEKLFSLLLTVGPCIQRVKAALEGKEENDRAWTGPSEDEPTYRLLVDCNQLAVDIDNEIGIIHNFMRDKYRLKFPELESLVHHPIDYARVVLAIGNASRPAHAGSSGTNAAA